MEAENIAEANGREAATTDSSEGETSQKSRDDGGDGLTKITQ